MQSTIHRDLNQSLKPYTFGRNRILDSLMGYPKPPNVHINRDGNDTLFSIRIDITENDIETWNRFKDDPILFHSRHPISEGMKKFLKFGRDIYVYPDIILLSQDFQNIQKEIYKVKNEQERQFILSPSPTESLYMEIDYEILMEEFYWPSNFKQSPFQNWLQ